MPIVEVTITQGRPPEVLRKLITELTEAVVRSGAAPKDNVRVVIRELPREHFAAGDVTIAERLAAQRDGQRASPEAPAAGGDVIR